MLPAALSKGRAATLDEVAEYLGLTRRVVRNLVRRHAIPALDTGHSIRFDELAFNALLEALRCRSMSSAAQVATPYRLPASSGYRTAGGSKYADVLARLESSSRRKKQPPSKPRSSGTLTTASVVALGPMRKP